MTRQHDSMIHPKIEDLLERVDSKFSLVTLGAYRARQINAYFNQLGEGLGHMIPPQVSSTARKPLSIAFEEIAVDKIVKIARPDYDAMEAEAAEMFGDLPVGDVAVDESGDITDASVDTDDNEATDAPAEDSAE
ncbi:MAG: DNA-directed RNA polymerase subunit omega [Actinomycetota bacterium]